MLAFMESNPKTAYALISLIEVYLSNLLFLLIGGVYFWGLATYQE